MIKPHGNNLKWLYGEVKSRNDNILTVSLIHPNGDPKNEEVLVSNEYVVEVSDFLEEAEKLSHQANELQKSARFTEAYQACLRLTMMYENFDFFRYNSAKLKSCDILLNLGEIEKAESFFQEMMNLANDVSRDDPNWEKLMRLAFNGMTSYVGSILARSDDLSLRHQCFEIVFQQNWNDFVQTVEVTIQARYLQKKAVVTQALDKVELGLKIEDEMLSLCSSKELTNQVKFHLYHTYIKGTVAECGAMKRHKNFDLKEFRKRLETCKELLDEMEAIERENQGTFLCRGDIIVAEGAFRLDSSFLISKQKQKIRFKEIKRAHKYYEKALSLILKHHGSDSMEAKAVYIKIAQVSMFFDPKKAQKYLKKAERIHVGKKDDSVNEIISNMKNMAGLFRDSRLPWKQKLKKEKHFHRCSNVLCTETETSGNKFLVCGRCKASKYCSRKCQKIHWKSGHKKVCETAR